jgi:hypothetical protein
MTGAIAALVGAGGAGGGGGTVGALSWGSISGSQAGSNAALTITGISSAHSFEAGPSSGGVSLGYTLNGTYVAYTGAFNVHNGDTLGWTVVNNTKPTKSGTVTVTDLTDGGAVVDTFSYVVVGTGFDE